MARTTHGDVETFLIAGEDAAAPSFVEAAKQRVWRGEGRLAADQE
jgi:hypothetical protein